MVKTPSIILLPGSFMPDEVYQTVRDAVTARGVDIHLLSLTSGRLGPSDNRKPPDMFDDAVAISLEVEKLADEGKDVVLVSSSYSGVPLTQSCEGLSKAERANNSKSGGLVKIGFMPSIIPAIGQAAYEVLVDVSQESNIPMKSDDAGWLEMDPDHHSHIGSLIFSNLPPDRQLAWAKATHQHSSRVFGDKVTFLSYALPGVDLAFFFCENDKLVSPKNQQLAIDRLEKASGKKVDVSMTKGDHTPTLSVPKDVVDWLLRISNIE